MSYNGRECCQEKFPKGDVTGQVSLDRAKGVGARYLSKGLTVGLSRCSRGGVNIKYLLNSYMLGAVPSTSSALS